MPELRRAYYTVWVLQRKSRRGWWTITGSISDTKKGALDYFRNAWTDKKEGQRRWNQHRRQGEMRCVPVDIYIMEGGE